jgi:DNA-binding NarL/FixJ family response regulator
MLTNTGRPRILIAEDHTLVADLYKELLEPEFEVVGIVRDGRALVRAAEQLKPDVIVADISMPILNGLDAGRQVKAILPSVKLLFLTMNSDSGLAAEAFRCGACAYLLKTCAASEMRVAIRNALRGVRYMPQSISREINELLSSTSRELPRKNGILTNRQREVLQLLAEGKGMKEVGGVLNVTTRTVAFHKYRIMSVLGVKNNADLVKYAVRHHLAAA